MRSRAPSAVDAWVLRRLVEARDANTLDLVSGIIEGRRWLSERLRFLEAELHANPADDVRLAIEAEIARLREQQGVSRLRWRRWLFLSGPPPEL
jgi:hypothetical protein